MKNLVKLLLASALISAAPFALSQNAPKAEDKEAAYTRTINQRADKIVTTLDLADSNKATRVHEVITRQYRELRKIHETRDAQIMAAREKFDADKTAADAAMQAARDEARPKVAKLHGEFLARLSGELSPEQVDQVKDGMTYGVVPLTYAAYLRKHPELTEEQKQQIMEWLVEAREIAMDGGTSKEKHAVFGKYKGRINNYLSDAGYNAKKGEHSLKKAGKAK